MKWKGNRQSDNVEDRRGMSGTGKAIAGGGLIAIVFFLVKAFFPEAAPFVDT
jgi:predicted metalloprotease